MYASTASANRRRLRSARPRLPWASAEFRLHLDGETQGLDRLVVALEFQQRVAEIVQRLGIARFEIERSLDQLHGAGSIALLQADHTAHLHGPGVTVVKRQSLPVDRLGLIQLPLLMKADGLLIEFAGLGGRG